MQVVYSGGSSTPSPSPRLQRKNYAGVVGGYGRPVMPGYMMGGAPHSPHPHPPASSRASREKVGGSGEGERSLRDSIPAMSRPLAVTCLMLNIVLPGLGTLISGLTVLCGSQVRPKGASKGSVLWTNSGVALLQFFLTFLLLLGWIWSIMWGTAFLSISKEYYRRPLVEEVSTNGRPKSGSGTPKREQRRDSSPSPHPHHAHHPHHHHPSTSTSTSASPRTQVHNGQSPNPPESSRQQQQHQQHHQQLHHHQQAPPHRNGLSVNAVSGAATPDIYVTPSGPSDRPQPIIVLQEAPVSVNHSHTPPAPSRALMNARTRHEKILQRQMSDHELSPFILTHQQLEAIVIHDAPVLSRPPRPGLARGDSDPSLVPLPKS